MLVPPLTIEHDRIEGPSTAATVARRVRRPREALVAVPRRRARGGARAPTSRPSAWPGANYPRTPPPIRAPGSSALAVEAAATHGRFWPLTRELLRLHTSTTRADLHRCDGARRAHPRAHARGDAGGTGSDRIATDVASALGQRPVVVAPCALHRRRALPRGARPGAGPHRRSRRARPRPDRGIGRLRVAARHGALRTSAPKSGRSFLMDRPTPSVSDVVRRAVEICDPDDADQTLGRLEEQFEDDDEPITGRREHRGAARDRARGHRQRGRQSRTSRSRAPSSCTSRPTRASSTATRSTSSGAPSRRSGTGTPRTSSRSGSPAD